MRTKEDFLNVLEVVQKGCRAELITKEIAGKVYDDIKTDWENMSEQDKERFVEYRYSKTQATSNKWSKNGTVITAGKNREGEFDIFVNREGCGKMAFVGFGKKMKVIKADGTVGIKQMWYGIK